MINEFKYKIMIIKTFKVKFLNINNQKLHHNNKKEKK